VPDFTSFCSEVVTLAPNHTVDEAINDYLSLVEEDLSLAWSTFTSTLNQYASRYDFTVCDDCLTVLKLSFCASLTPSCGFLQCYEDAVDEIEAQCLPTYDYTTTTGASSYQCESECGGNLESLQAAAVCYLCEANCISSIILGSCYQFMMSRSICTGLLSVCACDTDQADIDTVCQFFDDDGYDIPFPTGLSCSATPHWCDAGNKKKRSAATQQPGVIYVNEYVQFQAPQATGQDSIANPLISPGTQPPVNAKSNSGMVLATSVGFILSMMALCC